MVNHKLFITKFSRTTALASLGGLIYSIYQHLTKMSANISIVSLREWHISSQQQENYITPVFTGQRHSRLNQWGWISPGSPVARLDKAADLSDTVLLTPEYFQTSHREHTRSPATTMVMLQDQLKIYQERLQMIDQDRQTAQALLADIINERFTLEDMVWLQNKLSTMTQISSVGSPDKPFAAPEISIRQIRKPVFTSTVANSLSSTNSCISLSEGPDLCQPETHGALPKYDGSTDLNDFKTAFAQCAKQYSWNEWQQIIWLKEALLTGEIRAAVFTGAIQHIDQVWNILEWEKLSRSSAKTYLSASSPATKKVKVCKNCGGSHPPYVCITCVYCKGFHYHNRCPHKPALSDCESMTQ